MASFALGMTSNLLPEDREFPWVLALLCLPMPLHAWNTGLCSDLWHGQTPPCPGYFLLDFSVASVFLSQLVMCQGQAGGGNQGLETIHPVKQWSPVTVASRTSFGEDSFSMDQGWGDWFHIVHYWFHIIYNKHITFIVNFICIIIALWYIIR